MNRIASSPMAPILNGSATSASMTAVKPMFPRYGLQNADPDVECGV